MPHATTFCWPPPDALSSAQTVITDPHISPKSEHPSLPNDHPLHNIHIAGKCPCATEDNSALGEFRRRHSSQAKAATTANMTANGHSARKWSSTSSETPHFVDEKQFEQLRHQLDRTLNHNVTSAPAMSQGSNESLSDQTCPPVGSYRKGGSLAAAMTGTLPDLHGVSMALNDTPATTAPNSPQMLGRSTVAGSSISDTTALTNLPAPVRHSSGSVTPRIRPTTLDIPGLTKSKVSPDGRIAQRDVGSKLVIVMVGLPARGKSYITKKLARYLNWLQHDTRIFNVGERRRTVAGGPLSGDKNKTTPPKGESVNVRSTAGNAEASVQSPSVAQIVLNGETPIEPPATPGPLGNKVDSFLDAKESLTNQNQTGSSQEEGMEQNSDFFDPHNKRGFQIREQVARETLDELLDYILYQGGAVGILDATNSTLERRKMVMERIRERAGPQLNVLFLESRCVDKELLEANMRLKLNGPDYRDMDPTKALEDFRKRVQEYEKAYVPLGQYEEDNDMPYIQMIDVGRKVISHQIKGFLMAQANYYLLNFNLTPRQIWITRHGLSEDNISGKIGGDSALAPEGIEYAKALTRFMDEQRREWDQKQRFAHAHTHFPPQPGDSTPPNPHYHPHTQDVCGKDIPDSSSVITDSSAEDFPSKAFCVWTSMLKRSIDTAQFFDEEDYDIKQMRMLDELNAGVMEGLTYSCISSQYPEEYASRRADKLHYRYPGPGGEGYLDIINRLRPVIVELERMTDHVLLIGHRSVSRVLLAYFRGLGREEVADLDVPIGMLYCLEPKPYGVDFHAYKWDPAQQWFYEVPNFKLKRADFDMQ